MKNRFLLFCFAGCFGLVILSMGCRVETVGDPEKPIKIEAHITVDIRKLKDTAYDIEDMVSGEKSVPIKDSSLNKIRRFFDVSSVYAAQMTLRYSTPATDKAISQRRDRFSVLRNLKQQGLVGEDNRGYLNTLGGGASVSSVVKAENHDRRIIYNAIVQQNGMAPTDIGVVERTFAEVQREKASPGEKIQLDNGQWITK